MDIGKIQPAEITEEMQRSYLDYAMSVIVARALPDVRDGLKPVHRRILFAMHEMGLAPGGRFTKSAKIVGETMGKYHPHGDLPIYDALVRMAQDFSMRYPLVHGQGNFGSMDGDPPAAMRYTEAKLSAIATELLQDIEKETADFIPNFDGTLKDPLYLPAKLPNLLLMGSEGIAVGMATKIPPHNLSEVVDALIFMIERRKPEEQPKEAKNESWQIRKIDLEKDIETETETETETEIGDGLEDISFEFNVDTEELLNFIKGPDFPTGGAIYDYQEILPVYATGRGRILIRGKAEIEEASGRSQIIISEIPYQVNKAELVKRIAELARDKKIPGISDLRDESDREGVRVVVELKRDAKPKAVLNNLYQKTSLQTTFPANSVVLVDGTPRTLTLKEILVEYLKHRYLTIQKRSLFELREAKARAHILEGLKIALDNLDAVIETIKKSKDADEAKKNLMEKFSLTDIQATAILDMQLRRLAALERQKIEDEYKLVQELIAYLTDLLAHPAKIFNVIKEELIKLREKYGDQRRTRVYRQKIAEFSEEDLVPQEETVVVITRGGYIKRIPPVSFRSQSRGGKGVSGMTTKDTDEIKSIIAANTHDQILFFTDRGRVFRIRVFELVEGQRQAKGQALTNLINIEQGENIQATLTIGKENGQSKKTAFLLMVTKKGIVKKTKIADFTNIRTSGLIAIKLSLQDELCWVKETSGEDHILLASHDGKSIRFSEKDIRPTGRSTMGVRGIKLGVGDCVVGMEVFPPRLEPPADKRRKFFRDILVVMEKGLGKRTKIEEFPLQRRGGQGVKIAQIVDKTGKIVCFQLVNQDIEHVVLTSKLAQVIKLPLKNIPRLGRATQGVILMRFSKDSSDSVAAATCL